MDAYVPYGERSEWSDVTPVLQDDGDSPACPILYTPQFEDVMNYFRAISAADEMSERALALTEEVVTMNAANYSVWHFRRRVLAALGGRWEAERDYVAGVISNNLKNYQVWHHRQAVVQALNDGSQEVEFTAEVLSLDAKNYHAWQHRHWAMKTFQLFSSVPNNGLDYVDTLLAADVRNNSAWNHRFFIITNTTGFTPDVAREEIDVALEHLKLAPSNESPWNYIRGACKAAGLQLFSQPSVEAVCQSVLGQGTQPAAVLAMLVEIDEGKAADPALPADQRAAAQAHAEELCKTLAESVDEIRAKYWQFRGQCIRNK